jgi:uncharacterized protein (TIGR00369 family)
MPKITVEEFQALVEQELPVVQLFNMSTRHIGRGEAVMVMHCDERTVRPGGTVAGPALMALADVCMYAVVLGLIGRVELAVTTNLNINFLRKPPIAPVLAEGRILKLGKRLAVGEVLLRSEASDDLVGHVTGTYSIPPSGDRVRAPVP